MHALVEPNFDPIRNIYIILNTLFEIFRYSATRLNQFEHSQGKFNFYGKNDKS